MRLQDLTRGEREVLKGMADGLSNRGLAERLYLSERGVEKRVQEALWKATGRLDEPRSLYNRRVLAVLAYVEACSEEMAA